MVPCGALSSIDEAYTSAVILVMLPARKNEPHFER
jgi:hypothetical protein